VLTVPDTAPSPPPPPPPHTHAHTTHTRQQTTHLELHEPLLQRGIGPGAGGQDVPQHILPTAARPRYVVEIICITCNGASHISSWLVCIVCPCGTKMCCNAV
jgi:hypothetical protein